MGKIIAQLIKHNIIIDAISFKFAQTTTDVTKKKVALFTLKQIIKNSARAATKL